MSGNFSSETTEPADLEAILDQLINSEDRLPIEAFEQARQHPAAITPLLIHLVEKATDDCRRGFSVECEGHFFAAYLLAEFGAVESWPAIRASIALPDDLPFDLYSDAVTEDLDFIIASVIGDQSEDLYRIIADSTTSAVVGGTCVNALLFLVRDGRLDRFQVIDRLTHLLEQAIEAHDNIADILAIGLDNLGAASALPLIEKAFARNLIDGYLIRLEDVREDLSKPDETFVNAMASLKGFDDSIERLRQWAVYSVQSDAEGETEVFNPQVKWLSTPEDDDPWFPEDETQVDSDPLDEDLLTSDSMPRVGRNEPCPCGSGRKFKKCCGIPQAGL